jgi:glycosyltransferase involved in cell wall biosynthesis
MMPGYYADKRGTLATKGSLVPVKVMEDYDVIVAQRRFLDPDLTVLEHLKGIGKKIVVDMDDQLLNIPPKNPAHRVYTPALKRNVKRCLHLADLITVSTEHLADEMRRYSDRVVVLPNSIDPDWRDVKRGPVCKTGTTGKVRIGWVGSKTHDEDLREINQVLTDLLSERDDVEILYMGGYPGCVIEPLIDEGLVFKNEAKKLVVNTEEIAERKKIWLVKGVPIQEYYDRLLGLGLHIGLAPLVDNTFNRSKSNLKFLEYTLAGVPTIASAVLPYSQTITDGHNGIIVKKNRYELWKRAIVDLVENEKKRIALFTNAKKLVREKFDIRKNQRLWAEQYRKLVEAA